VQAAVDEVEPLARQARQAFRDRRAGGQVAGAEARP
jgi:hypothetical protein